MTNAIECADAIYSDALQIINHYAIDPQLIPLVMGQVAQRLELFAIGDMARELNALKQEPTEDTEVDNG